MYLKKKLKQKKSTYKRYYGTTMDFGQVLARFLDILGQWNSMLYEFQYHGVFSKNHAFAI